MDTCTEQSLWVVSHQEDTEGAGGIKIHPAQSGRLSQAGQEHSCASMEPELAKWFSPKG